jgi:HK97 family phage major capsid protein
MTHGTHKNGAYMSPKLREMEKQHEAALANATEIRAKASAENRTLTDLENQHIGAHVSMAQRVEASIREYRANNTLAQQVYEHGFANIALGAGPGQRPHLVGRENGANAPDMGRFQAEFHDWVNTSLGSPWPRMTADTDTPIYIGSGTGIESVGFTVPKEVLPFLPAYYNLDSFGLAGARIIETADTIPLVFPVLAAGPAAETFGEGAAPTASQPFSGDSFTLNGTKYARLVKASYESLMNSALPLQGAIQDELLASLATTLTAAVTTSMLAALTANANVLVAQGSNDYYKTLGAVLHAIPPRFDLPANKWMASRATLAKIKDQRATTSGIPMFDPTTNQIFGKPFIVNDNLTGGQVVYGDWQDGVIIRRTPVIVRVFYEKYAEQGEVGFRVMQWNDAHSLCELSDIPNQPLYYTVLA